MASQERTRRRIPTGLVQTWNQADRRDRGREEPRGHERNAVRHPRNVHNRGGDLISAMNNDVVAGTLPFLVSQPRRPPVLQKDSHDRPLGRRRTRQAGP